MVARGTDLGRRTDLKRWVNAVYGVKAKGLRVISTGEDYFDGKKGVFTFSRIYPSGAGASMVTGRGVQPRGQRHRDDCFALSELTDGFRGLNTPVGKVSAMLSALPNVVIRPACIDRPHLLKRAQ